MPLLFLESRTHSLLVFNDGMARTPHCDFADMGGGLYGLVQEEVAIHTLVRAPADRATTSTNPSLPQNLVHGLSFGQFIDQLV